MLPLGGQTVGLEQQALAGHGFLPRLVLVEELLQRGQGEAAHVARDERFILRVDDEEGRDAGRLEAAEELRVFRVFRVDREPDKLSGIPLQRRIRENVCAHRAAGVSPRGPGFGEFARATAFV